MTVVFVHEFFPVCHLYVVTYVKRTVGCKWITTELLNPHLLVCIIEKVHPLWKIEFITLKAANLKQEPVERI